MILSITQPYFFPYLGLFQLIHATDRLIVFDTVKYRKRSWMNRNRILHPNKSFNYISMPVKRKPENTAICDIEIVGGDGWKEKILGQFSVYAKRAPHYREVRDLITDCFSVKETMYAPLCLEYMSKICEYLRLDLKYDFFSVMDVDIKKVKEPGEWSFYICKELKTTRYLNMPAGVSIFNENLFSENGIELLFLEPRLRSYQQFNKDFSSHLSILDVLMWNSIEEVREMIVEDYGLLTKREMEQRA